MLRFPNSSSFAGLFVIYSGGEHIIYVTDFCYSNASIKRPPEERVDEQWRRSS